MDPQLYMWSPVRRNILERHDTYVEAVLTRVISQFRDIDGEAERYADATWQALTDRPVQQDEDVDMGALAEQAQDAGLAKYETLSFLKREMLLGSPAGLYHIWDRSLRDFLAREFRHWMKPEYVDRYAWHSDFNRIMTCLRESGWDVTAEPFFKDLDACRLVVNVYKHGKGKSLDDLVARYPHFMRYHAQPDLSFLARHPDHEDLELTERQFRDIASSLRTFWTAFPEAAAAVSGAES